MLVAEQYTRPRRPTTCAMRGKTRVKNAQKHDVCKAHMQPRWSSQTCTSVTSRKRVAVQHPVSAWWDDNSNCFLQDSSPNPVASVSLQFHPHAKPDPTRSNHHCVHWYALPLVERRRRTQEALQQSGLQCCGASWPGHPSPTILCVCCQPLREPQQPCKNDLECPERVNRILRTTYGSGAPG
jgi:hypothetical protein